jgi:hypothetical protein
MTRSIRTLLAAVLGLLAMLAILLALLAHYVNHTLVNSSNFANRAVSVLQTPGVQSLIVQAVTDRIVAEAGNETRLQPLIQSAVVNAVSSSAVDEEFRSAATSLQSQLVSGTADQLTLRLPNIGSAIASDISSQSPELADEIRNVGTITVLNAHIPTSDANDVHHLASASKDSPELLIGAILLGLLALIVAPNRRRAVFGLGLGATVGGVAAVVIYLGGRGIVDGEFSGADAQLAAHAVWSEYLGGLETSGIVLACVGVVIATVAALV